MPDSQNPEHTLALIREFQLKGINLVPTVTGEISPVVLIADLTAALPQVVRQAQGGATRAAAVGFVGQIQVFNNAGSGIVAELYQLAVSLGTAGAFNHGPFVSTQPTQITGQWQDRRLVGTPSCEIMSAADSATTQLVNPAIYLSLADTVNTIPLNVTLPPGTGWLAESTTQNDLFVASFHWIERDPLPGEL